jgi:hypothetical protein
VRKLLTGIFMVAFTMAAHAQEEPEYRMELGAGIGLVNYVGDFNSNLVKGMQPWATILAKYRLNPRMAVAMDIGTGKIKGESDNVSTWYPTERYEFNHSLTEADLRFEYNFWAYGTGEEYRGARRLTPFITAGLGVTFFGGENSGATANLPIGAGIKYKLGQRLNLTVEWAMRITPSDKLDGRSDVYGIKSSGLFKNTDCYSVFLVALSYDLWAKCKTCNNDRD